MTWALLCDARGQLASILDPTAGLWRFVHDEAGRLTRRIDPSASGTEQGGPTYDKGNNHRVVPLTNTLVSEAGSHGHAIGTTGDGGPHYHPFRTVLFCRKDAPAP